MSAARRKRLSQRPVARTESESRREQRAKDRTTTTTENGMWSQVDDGTESGIFVDELDEAFWQNVPESLRPQAADTLEAALHAYADEVARRKAG